MDILRREDLIAQVAKRDNVWDMVVIGGGATGLGVAVDAALRGYSVMLCEQDDFSKSTSSRSTKLVHGGVRYLAKGDVGLVLEALRERGLLKKNAPHLVKDQSFIVSNYSHWDNLLYTCGLTAYDILSWGLSLGRSRFISKRKMAEHAPASVRKGLKGGVIYHDGQFDDSRVAINLMQSCVELGGCPVNYLRAEGLLHDAAGKVSGVTVLDRETGVRYEVKARSVVNAAGIFVDRIMQFDLPDMPPMVRPSQGVHLVFERKFLPGEHGIMIPKTSDGRVLFAVPWHGKMVLGTTDIPREEPESEPQPLDREIDFILQTAAKYLDPAPTRADIQSMFAGQRPLAAPGKAGNGSTKEISRSHKIVVSPNSLITIIGGKWTTYRRMAQDVVDKAGALGLLPQRPCGTEDFRLHGYRPNPDLNDHLYVYGSDGPQVRALAQDPALGERLSDRYAYTAAEVVWAVRYEMARTVEDVLARRVRLLFVDAREAQRAAEKVAGIMARELDKDRQWADGQVTAFHALASGYYPSQS